jgi:mannose-6-phosphate isomerase-like protein (cupin superfamily)
MIVSKLQSLEEGLPPFQHGMCSNEIFTHDQSVHARVALSILGPGGCTEMHMHPGSEHYFLMLEGELLVRTNKDEVIVGPGECVLIKDDEPHQVINMHDEETRYFAICTPRPKAYTPYEPQAK